MQDVVLSCDILTLRTMATRIPLIDAARCSGCGACIGACAPRVLAFEQRAWRKLTVLQSEALCTGCAKCQGRCWTHAIQMVLPTAASRTTSLKN